MREAEVDDVPFIAGLFRLPHARKFLNEPGRDAILDLIEGSDGEAFVIEADGKDFGYFTLYDRGWLVELGVLVVKSVGTGAGPFAMRWALDEAFEKRRAHRIFIEIREDNARARTMCERLGFTAEGLYREGFRDARTGKYHNLVPYGLLRA